ncbi:MAG: hypothetical protein H6581_17655 [Bacteroidia bacterium]|nr:hypothetical protein [Bacteroidia bacterium]
MEVIVDGCAINQGPKCDYLLIQSSGFEHFVELKGVDIPHAFKQIEATILKLSSNPKGIEKHAYIISTSCPLTTSQIQIQKSKFKKNFNSSLLVKNSPVTSRLN